MAVIYALLVASIKYLVEQLRKYRKISSKIIPRTAG